MMLCPKIQKRKERAGKQGKKDQEMQRERFQNQQSKNQKGREANHNTNPACITPNRSCKSYRVCAPSQNIVPDVYPWYLYSDYRDIIRAMISTIHIGSSRKCSSENRDVS